MPEYLSPGVYIEEQTTGPRPIEGVSTSTAAFIGPTERGPEHPRLVLSWLEFQRWYGTYLTNSVMPHAVQGFFDNGGQRLFIARVVSETAPSPTTRTVGNLVLMAVGRGLWGNNILVRIDGATHRNVDLGRPWFKLTLLYYRRLPDMDNFLDPLDVKNAGNPALVLPDYVEQYDDLVHTHGAGNNVENVVNSASHLVRVWFDTDTPDPVPTDAVNNYAQLGTGGGDGDPITADTYTGNMDPLVPGSPRSEELLGRGRGLAALEAITDLSLIAAPDTALNGNLAPVIANIINQCEQLKDRFAVVSTVSGQNDTQAQSLARMPDTSYAAVYYPWIEIYDPLGKRPLRIPPTGHVTGLIARTDIDRGVHKAPANEVLRDATNLEFPVPKGMQDVLNPRGINCIRDFSTEGRGIRVWGARTVSSDPQWKYINVRRLFIFIEQSIYRGTQWVVFEPNDEPLWAQLRRSINNFLINVWKSGALMGLTQEEAFFVKCDRTTMTQDDIDNGRLVCYIGIAPVKPAEFVIFRISQKTAEAPA
jgi:phage tail sheath protein FI